MTTYVLEDKMTQSFCIQILNYFVFKNIRYMYVFEDKMTTYVSEDKMTKYCRQKILSPSMFLKTK